MTAAGTHEAPRRKITRRLNHRRHRARLVVKKDYSIALYEVWSLRGAQICSKFFLFFFTKTQKTHRCTFATDAGRRLRTTRTSLDVDISSVRLPFSSILLCLRRSLKFFCFSSLVLSSVVLSSSSSSYAYFIIKPRRFLFAQTNNRWRGHTESVEFRRVPNLSKSSARTTREANAARLGRGESSGTKRVCFSSSLSSLFSLSLSSSKYSH